MTYEESECQCDWCAKRIGSGDDLMCRACEDKLERERDLLRDQLKEARHCIDELESRLSSLEGRDR